MKKILLVMFILLCVFLPPKVQALEDSFYEAEYIPGEYIKKFKNNSGKYEQLRFFRRVSDNKPVYCIQIWETLSNNKTITGYDNNQYNYASIDYGTWERIMLIAYYGYGYLNHTDSKWYAITQFMIWQETAKDTTLYFTNALNGNKITKYENEMEEINALIRNHSTVPSFNQNNFDVTYNTEYVIQDTNLVLDNYDITYKAGATIYKDNNKIVLSTKKIGNSRINLAKTDKLYQNNPIVYIDNDGQNLLLPGKYYPIYSVFQVSLNSGNVIINKLDYETNSNISSGNARLNESVFELIDSNNNVVATSILENEKIIFKNIGYGNYILKEKQAGTGYLLNNESKQITVNSENTTVNFYNQAIKNRIEINKYLKNPQTEELIKENAKFTVYDQNEKEILTFETNNGYYEFDLPYGIYTLKQITGMKNHKFVDDVEIEVKENGLTQKFNLYNEELVVPIKINNLDNDSLLPILEEGAIFTITNVTNNETKTITTNDLGSTETIFLSSGTYEIKQIDSVDGYLINEEKIVLEVNEDNYEFDQETVEIDIPNKKMKSKIEINKIIEYYLDDKLIESKMDNSIVIPIYAKEDIYSKDGIKIYDKNQEVDVVSYDGNNILSKELILGNYYIKDEINNKNISIYLDNLSTKKINILDRVYEYTESDNTFIERNNVIDDIPNTYSENKKNMNINLLSILIGSFLIHRGKRNENK